jgi:hypothetical protein
MSGEDAGPFLLRASSDRRYSSGCHYNLQVGFNRLGSC